MSFKEFLTYYKDEIDFLTFIALVLGLTGFLITIYQLRSSSKDSARLKNINNDLRNQLIEFQKQNADLLHIKESISTKYIGLFPDFVPYTLDILRNAKKSIEIVCDFPCYSYFTDYKKYTAYTGIIQEKEANGVVVSLTCPNQDRRNELAMRQLGFQNNTWIKKYHLREKIIEFMERENINTAFDDVTFMEINNKIEELNKYILGLVFRNRHVEIDQELPVFYWIVDDNEAVFSIPSFIDFNREQGFFTSDARLIKALKDTNLKLKLS